MENKETVCAVVVTYNRKKLLKECLEALIKQTRPIQAIYLIDNASTDGTPDLLLEKDYIKELPPKNLSKPWEKEFEIKNLTDEDTIKLYYVRMHENTGGAGGFHEGVKRGYERGYDWLWLMDDDAEPYIDSLEILSNYFKKKDIVGLAGTVIRPNGSIAVSHRGIVDYSRIFPLIQKPLDLNNYSRNECDIHTASFVGFLIKSEAIAKIGYPIKDFFIHHDDIEYSLRLLQIGKIKLIPKSKILHKEAAKKGIEKSFLWMKSERIPYDKLWLSYYSKRNLMWLGKKYTTNRARFYSGAIKSLIRTIVGVILFDDKKFKRIRFILNAYIDGLKGKFDNEKPKRLLY